MTRCKIEQDLERYKGWVEDMQAGFYVNCVYCGHRYGHEDDTPVSMADVLKEHISVCPEHPLSHALARIKELEAFVRDIRDNWDCDEDGHKYDIACRCCMAEDLIGSRGD